MSADIIRPFAVEACRLLGDQWHLDSTIGSGNSATVYKLQSPDSTAALKIYDPRFFEGENAGVEERRITDQMSLKGHGHPYLIDFVAAGPVGETYFLLMEYFPWNSLDRSLERVNYSEISSVLSKVASAAKFLEDRNFVHRDIKPANILISDDCQHVKLLDLGVMRPMSAEYGGDGTDHGYTLPFVATAQYSSPAYLFRDSEPTESMWKALTFYQLGGVLHDLLMKHPLFHDEVRTGNRYRTAAAVLLKTPEIYAPDAPASLISLARTCLGKDDDLRLSRVYWARFHSENDASLRDLRARLGLVQSENAARGETSMDQQRQERTGLLLDEARDNLVELGRHVLVRQGFPQAGMTRKHHSPSTKRSAIFSFVPRFGLDVDCRVHLAITLSLQRGSHDQLDLFVASFTTIGEGTIADEFDVDFVWTTTFESLQMDDVQLIEILTEEFIRRYASAEDKVHTMLDRNDIVLQFSHGEI